LDSVNRSAWTRCIPDVTTYVYVAFFGSSGSAVPPLTPHSHKHAGRAPARTPYRITPRLSLLVITAWFLRFYRLAIAATAELAWTRLPRLPAPVTACLSRTWFAIFLPACYSAYLASAASSTLFTSLLRAAATLRRHVSGFVCALTSRKTPRAMLRLLHALPSSYHPPLCHLAPAMRMRLALAI